MDIKDKKNYTLNHMIDKKQIFEIVASDDLGLLRDNETKLQYLLTRIKCKIWLMFN